MDRVQPPAGPCHLDRVTDGPFHTAGCCIMTLGNRGIEHLGNTDQNLFFIHRDGDSIPQILISFDMCRDSDLMKQTGHIIFQILADILASVHIRIGIATARLSRQILCAHTDPANLFHQQIFLKGLHNKIAGSQTERIPGHLLAACCRYHDE